MAKITPSVMHRPRKIVSAHLSQNVLYAFSASDCSNRSRRASRSSQFKTPSKLYIESFEAFVGDSKSWRLCNSSVLLFSLDISTFIMMRNAIALILEFFLQKWLNGITAWIKNLSWPSWKFQLTHLIFSRAAKWAIAEFAGNRPYPQAILGNFPRPRAKPSVSENFPNCLRMRAISYTNSSDFLCFSIDLQAFKPNFGLKKRKGPPWQLIMFMKT